jgi:lipoprotein-anchoring transpeptidase ErfK/SrfK
MRRALVLVGLLVVFATAAALGVSAETREGSTSRPAAESPAPVRAVGGETAAPAPLQEPPAAISVSLGRSKAAYGDILAVRGVLAPASPDETVVIELQTGTGWVGLRSTTTQADGTFVAKVDVTKGSLVRARPAAGDAVSQVLAVSVTPKVTVKPAKGLSYGGARIAARVRPASYAGTVAVRVEKHGEEVANRTTTVENGKLRTTVPLPGVGRFRVVLGFPERDGLAARVTSARVVAKGRALSVGAMGPDVRGLRERLAELHVHVPARSSTFGYELRDAVLAFQKAYGLDRTGTVDAATWRKLEAVRVIKPRSRGPALHIEVDKTRQILMVVEKGQVSAVLPVSSGATGNTPEGRHQIRWKALATTTWLGPGILYRTMTFYENSIAIHGWASVPEYAASHGCVRIPIWAADWLYQRSHVGETVYVYS